MKQKFFDFYILGKKHSISHFTLLTKYKIWEVNVNGIKMMLRIGHPNDHPDVQKFTLIKTALYLYQYYQPLHAGQI